MSAYLRSSLIVTAAAIACSCTVPATVADTQERLRQVTASVIAGAGEAKDIAISNVRAFPTRREWQATTGGKLYACDADEQLNLPQCRAAEPTTAKP